MIKIENSVFAEFQSWLIDQGSAFTSSNVITSQVRTMIKKGGGKWDPEIIVAADNRLGPKSRGPVRWALRKFMGWYESKTGVVLPPPKFIDHRRTGMEEEPEHPLMVPIQILHAITGRPPAELWRLNWPDWKKSSLPCLGDDQRCPAPLSFMLHFYDWARPQGGEKFGCGPLITVMGQPMQRMPVEEIRILLTKANARRAPWTIRMFTEEEAELDWKKNAATAEAKMQSATQVIPVPSSPPRPAVEFIPFDQIDFLKN